MRRRRTRLVLTAVLALLPVAGQAGDFSSIEESVSAGAEINYVFERWAALHFAVLNYAGENRFPPEQATAAKDFISKLIALSVVERRKSSKASPEIVQDSVHQDVLRISEIYEARFRKNYAETGQAFMQDALVNADLDFCKYLGDELNG